MCGRFIQHRQISLFMRELQPDWQAPSGTASPPLTWNLAPSQEAWAVLRETDALEPKRMRWGFQSAWAKQGSPKPINARAETAATKPFFRHAWLKSRCVVPADGYYEWQAEPAGKRPFHISLADGRPMFMAGLYSAAGDMAMPCFAVVTVAATPALAELHGRMPLMLEPAKVIDWLDIETSARKLGVLASSPCGQELTWPPVSKKVNDPRYDDAKLLR